MNYNNYTLGASVGTPQKDRQQQQQQQQQVTSPQSVMQNSPHSGGNMNMNTMNRNMNNLSMYPNSSQSNQSSNQSNPNQQQFYQQPGQSQPQQQYYVQQQQQYQPQYQYQNQAPSPLQTFPPFQQQFNLSPSHQMSPTSSGNINSFDQFQYPQQQTSPTSASAAPQHPYQHGYHPSVPTMQVSSPMSAHAPSPQTTPSNQPIKTTIPNAPRKGPRPDSAASEDPFALAVLAPTNDSSPRKNANTPNRSRTSSYASSNASSYSNQSNRKSVLDDPTFAPPPKFPQNLSVEKARFFGDKSDPSGKPVIRSTLPSFGMVKHAGEVMGRFSMKSMIIKKWRMVYWIAYGNSQVLFFRSKTDFEEWVSNPYLKKEDRDALVKMSLDFMNDLHLPHLHGYKVTTVRKKGYNRNGML